MKCTGKQAYLFKSSLRQGQECSVTENNEELDLKWKQQYSKHIETNCPRRPQLDFIGRNIILVNLFFFTGQCLSKDHSNKITKCFIFFQGRFVNVPNGQQHDCLHKNIGFVFRTLWGAAIYKREGKTTFISCDCRRSFHNKLYILQMLHICE